MREVFSCVVTTESELVMGGGGLGGRSDAEGVGGVLQAGGRQRGRV